MRIGLALLVVLVAAAPASADSRVTKLLATYKKEAAFCTKVATGIGKRAAKPVLVPQSHLRTGTHDAAPAAHTMNYGQLDQPTVWRSGRASAVAQVAALEESGVERFDIPAFLRKQAD